MDSSPVEVDLDSITLVYNLDQPESLRLEITDTIVAINDESEGRKLTRTVADDLIVEFR